MPHPPKAPLLALLALLALLLAACGGAPTAAPPTGAPLVSESRETAFTVCLLYTSPSPRD